MRKFSIALFLIVSSSTSQAQLDNMLKKNVASDRFYPRFYYGKSIAMDGDFAIVGSPRSARGSAYLLKRTKDEWVEKQIIMSSNGTNGQEFGRSVAIHGDIAVVGAYKERLDSLGDNDLYAAGAAYVFENIGGTWTQVQTLFAYDRAKEDQFGNSVAISGNSILVGANKSPYGEVYVFEREDSVWNFTQKLTTESNKVYRFGSSIAMDSNQLIIGDFLENLDANDSNKIPGAGAAYIFEKQTGRWVVVQKLVASDRAVSDKFGSSVGISGNRIIVGAPEEDHNVFGEDSAKGSGSVYLYEKKNDTWMQTDKIVSSNRDVGEKFGFSVAIKNDRAIVGAPYEEQDAKGVFGVLQGGAVYLLAKSDGEWIHAHKVTAPERAAIDRFGWSVAISKDLALVGAPWEDEDPYENNYVEDAGSVYTIPCIRNLKTLWINTCTDYRSPSRKHLWTKSGMYFDRISVQSSCDSFLTVNLTIAPIDKRVIRNGGFLRAKDTIGAYQWLDCNNNFQIIQGETGRDFVFADTGEFAVEIRQTGCIDTSDCFKVLNINVANDATNSIKVYPNPTNSMLYVELKSSLVRNVEIQIFDLRGVLTYDSGQLKHTANMNEKVDISRYESGAYILTLKSEGRVIYRQHVVKVD
jgi:hypothetical protein